MIRDLAVAITFFTRLPWPIQGDVGPADISRSSRYYPIVGLLVGLAVALVYRLSLVFVPPLLAATLAVVASIVVTGGFHEDALADVADGFGGGYTRERKLEIMKDSRLGTYGTLAALLALLVRIQAIATLSPDQAIPALMAVHALSRIGIVWMLRLLPVARREGLGADAHRLSWVEPIMASLLGMGIGWLTLGVQAWLPLAAVALGTVLISRLSMDHIGGITGDVLGSAQQVGELFALLALAAMATHPEWGALTPWPWLR